ncbi:50S ribosome-binding GTPase [Candidatus Woesearchaeota archaeon]|nr:50S ribosome-binding GTPase [Candidatus Woesearchaeota archaeon]
MTQIQELEKELSNTKYNKRTQGHIGLVKAKIAMLKEKERTRGAGDAKGQGYAVRKTGDASIIMIGFPSAGKSTLLNAITNANSPVGAYEFTTLDVVPGLLEFKHAKIQVLDVPGIVRGAAMGRGRGKEVLAVMQNADMVLFIIDVNRPEGLSVLQQEVYDANIRVNQRKPDVKIVKKTRGGVCIGKTVACPDLDNKTIEGICKEMRLNNVDVVIRTPITADQFIDVIEGNKHYLPGIIVLNKIDMVSPDELELLKLNLKPDICMSADRKINTEALKDIIFDRLNLIRIYCKQIGKKADLDVPLIMKKGSTLNDMCQKLHKDFVSKFRFAKIWGTSVKFNAQPILKLTHVIQDKDVVELHIK